MIRVELGDRQALELGTAHEHIDALHGLFERQSGIDRGEIGSGEVDEIYDVSVEMHQDRSGTKEDHVLGS